MGSRGWSRACASGHLTGTPVLRYRTDSRDQPRGGGGRPRGEAGLSQPVATDTNAVIAVAGRVRMSMRRGRNAPEL